MASERPDSPSPEVKVQDLPFDQQNVVADRSPFLGSSACVLFHVRLTLRFLVWGEYALRQTDADWKRLLAEAVTEFDACGGDRSGHFPQPLLLKMAEQEGF